MNVLELNKVCKNFSGSGGQVKAVDSVSFTVGRGEIIALLGENGAGKTTLLDMVLGLTQPTSGQMIVLGKPPRQAIADGDISAVLQTGGLLQELSVSDQLTMLAATYSQPREVQEVLEMAGITDVAGRKIAKCSGGQQQKVKFAAALLSKPQLLILDEPTTGMDVNARKNFWAAMGKQAADGVTVIFATHYLEEAEHFAKRIILMDSGRILADDALENLRATSGAKVIGFKLPPEQTLTHADLADCEFTGFTNPSPRFYRLETNQPEAVLSYLLQRYHISDLTVTAPTLNDTFTQLTSH